MSVYNIQLYSWNWEHLFYVINRIPASILGSKIPLKIATNKTGDIIINLIPFYSPVLYIMLLRMRELLKIIRDIYTWEHKAIIECWLLLGSIWRIW